MKVYILLPDSWENAGRNLSGNQFYIAGCMLYFRVAPTNHCTGRNARWCSEMAQTSSKWKENAENIFCSMLDLTLFSNFQNGLGLDPREYISLDIANTKAFQTLPEKELMKLCSISTSWGVLNNIFTGCTWPPQLYPGWSSGADSPAQIKMAYCAQWASSLSDRVLWVHS